MESLNNPQVFQFPRVQDTVKQTLARGYLLLLVIQSILYCLVAAMAAGIFILANREQMEPNWHLLWLVLALAAIILPYSIGYFRTLHFFVREQDLGLFSGVIFRRLVVQPYSRLQHIEITRGPLERMLGLATLKLFSAGGAMHSLAIPGLPVERAEALREYILSSRGVQIEQ